MIVHPMGLLITYVRGERAVLLTGKALYRALGIPDVRHRRGKGATTHVLMRRVLSLDYLIERPTLGWLPTEDDKVRRLEGSRPARGPDDEPRRAAPCLTDSSARSWSSARSITRSEPSRARLPNG